MPPASSSPLAAPADYAACRALLRDGSRSFLAASLLLPRRLCEPAAALYAFCRTADDAVDLGGAASLDDALARLRDRLDRAYEGRPAEHPIDRALADVVARFAMPRTLLDALLEGFEWDAGGRRYEDLPALNAYAARVAGSVGAMMAVLMGARSPALLARACDLGAAMQLTNIARDVGEDARAGRLYLPAQWLREAGIDPEAWLARPVFTDALGGVVRRLLEAADALYARADAGIAGLPLACRPGIRAARHLYAEIGRAIARQDFDSITDRAVVPARRKLCLLGRALVTGPRAAPDLLAPPLPEADFLVAAGTVPAMAGAWRRSRRRSPWGRLDDRIAWAMELFERLDQLDLAEAARGGPVEPVRAALSSGPSGQR